MSEQPVAAVYDRRPSSPAVADRRYSYLFSFPARAASGLIWIYQRTLSPALTVISPNTGCRFSPTCSHYARAALAEHGFVAGLWFTARRLLKCGPWHPGGEDPVPPRKFSCTAVRHGSPLVTHHSSLSNG